MAKGYRWWQRSRAVTVLQDRESKRTKAAKDYGTKQGGVTGTGWRKSSEYTAAKGRSTPPVPKVPLQMYYQTINEFVAHGYQERGKVEGPTHEHVPAPQYVNRFENQVIIETQYVTAPEPPRRTVADRIQGWLPWTPAPPPPENPPFKPWPNDPGPGGGSPGPSAPPHPSGPPPPGFKSW